MHDRDKSYERRRRGLRRRPWPPLAAMMQQQRGRPAGPARPTKAKRRRSFKRLQQSTSEAAMDNLDNNKET